MARWSDLTSEPNSRQAIEFRASTLREARQTPITNRVSYLQDLARGKRVLDVGVVNHTISAQQDPNWLHGAIRSVAEYVLGVDILPEAVAKLQQAGYNVRLCDITRETIDDSFDIMIVGEVIEHLTDPGSLFVAAVRNLRPGGRLVLTTPNPYAIQRIRDAVLGRSEDSADHVIYLYPAGMAEMAERNQMQLKAYRGIDSANPRGLVGRSALATLRAFCSMGVSQDIFCTSLIYEFVRS